MTAVSAVIEVAGFHQRYGDFEAVRGIDLTVARGETLAFLGPNGAGKTTTVEVLEGFHAPTEGHVLVLGEPPARAGVEHRRRVGIVLQEAGFFEELTATETIDAWSRMYPSPRLVREVLEIVGLATRATLRVRNLSGGERRRLDLALGIVGRPEVLFLDEPTTGFDPEARRATWDVIDDLVDDGTTVFLTSHYLEEAQRLADRVIVIAGGRIVAQGSPDDLGGRDLAPGRITFRIPTGCSASDLPALDGHDAQLTVDGNGATIHTRALTAVTAAITGWATARGIELERLSVARPSLEETYLEIVGNESDDR
jgi:ABC-2 type transport system ATP-binding protein